MEILQDLKRELPHDSTIHFWDSKELKAGSWRDICTSLFTAALFRVAKRWKQAKYLPIDVVYTYNRILFSLKKEGNSVTCYSMDET